MQPPGESVTPRGRFPDGAGRSRAFSPFQTERQPDPSLRLPGTSDPRVNGATQGGETAETRDTHLVTMRRCCEIGRHDSRIERNTSRWLSACDKGVRI